MPNPTELKAERMPVACFAPPLTDGLIAKYEALANGLPRERYDVRDAMRECLAAVKFWWELPESKGDRDDRSLAIRHRGRDARIKVTSLTPDLVERMWDAVPWGYELDAMQSLFDRIDPAEKPLRDAAFHLLWFARELERDREPLTADKLPTG